MEVKLVIVVLIGIVHEGTLIPMQNGEGMVCTPGSNFKIECNYCFCDAFGMDYGCTKMACMGWADISEHENNQIDQPSYQYRKRETHEEIRKKRAADTAYPDENQSYLEDPAPLSFEQQQQLARQSYLQQQQDYYDRLQLQQDLAREQADLAEQQADLEQQNEEMMSQLELQQEQDAQQRQEDARQLALERQQQFIEQQAQKKQNEQYVKQYRNRNFRKGAVKNNFS